MTKLPRINAKELIKVVEKLGFVFERQRGSHMIFKHPDGRMTVIPYPVGEELGPGLLNQILKNELKITREELQKLL